MPLTAIAGARLFEDRRVGFLAGALLAVAFLPVHYSHFALNDAPTLAPLALCLVGVAGIYRTGRTREYVLAGAALGVAIATKYTAGILVVTIVAAAFASPVAHARVRNLAFVVRARRDRVPGRSTRTRCSTATRSGTTASASRPRRRATRAGQARPRQHQRLVVLPDHPHLGLRLAAVAGRARRSRRTDRAPPPAGDHARPAPILLFLYLGNQSRFFARWMLPVYPILCLLAAYGVVALASRFKPRVLVPALGALVLLAGARVQRPQRPRARPGRHPHGRPRVDEAEHPGRSEDRHGADRARPVGDRRRAPAVRRSARARVRAPAGTSIRRRARASFDGKVRETKGTACPVVKLEDYERTTRPGLLILLRAAAGSAGSSRARPSTAAPTSTRRSSRPRSPTTTSSSSAARRSSTSRPYGDAERGFSFDFSSTTTRSSTTARGRRSSSTNCPPARLRGNEARARHRRRLSDRGPRGPERTRVARRAGEHGRHRRGSARPGRARPRRPGDAQRRIPAGCSRTGSRRRRSSTRRARSTSSCSPATTAASSTTRSARCACSCSSAGIPAEDIFTDHAGFDTWDSAQRAKRVFDVDSAIVVTQRFHMARALYDARRAGLKVSGYEADRTRTGTAGS